MRRTMVTKRVEELVVYFTVLNDGTHLAASVAEPLFCVAGKNHKEARARAFEILDFHNERCANGAERPKKALALPSRTLTQFVPSHSERYTPDCVSA
jgi:hypothetical protein